MFHVRVLSSAESRNVFSGSERRKLAESGDDAGELFQNVGGADVLQVVQVNARGKALAVYP